MSTNIIKCPNCGHEFPIDEVLNHQAEEKYKKEFEEKLRSHNLEFQKRENILAQQQKDFEQKKANENELFFKRMEAEREKIIKDETQKAQKAQELQTNNLLQQIEKLSKQKEEAEKNELKLRNQQKELEEEKRNLDLIIARKSDEKAKEVSERISKLKDEENELKSKEKDLQIESMKKVIDELKRKSEQGSMQIQGEVLELEVESYLKDKFRFDDILEVPKGMRGADCIQVINTPQKQSCGKIIYECKSAKQFNGDWIEKLKEDMRASKSDIAVLISTIYPKDLERMGQKDGVWICSLEEFKGLSIALREGLIAINNVISQQQNKGDKITLLYDYLTSNEFRGHIEAIVESFSEMKIDLEKEKKYFLKIWKEREIQIDKVINNTVQMYGSIKGIGGKEIMTIQQLELPD